LRAEEKKEEKSFLLKDEKGRLISSLKHLKEKVIFQG